MPDCLRPLRCAAPLALAALCCSCSTEEERADAAFAELCSLLVQVEAELGAVTDELSADTSVETLEAMGDRLYELLEELRERGDSPDMPQEARQRLGAKWHEPLRAAVDAAVGRAGRIVRHNLYFSKPMERLARREMARYSTAEKRYPWPAAVLRGREYRPKLKEKE